MIKGAPMCGGALFCMRGEERGTRSVFSFMLGCGMLLLFYRTKEGEARLFLSDVGTKKVRSLVHYSFLPFFLAPHKKEAKKLSGSTYVFGVRSRSSVSLAVVSATTTKLTRPRVKTRFSSFAQTIDTMHSLRRVAYFASDSLMNPNPLRSFLSEKEVHSISQSIVVFPADLK